MVTAFQSNMIEEIIKKAQISILAKKTLIFMFKKSQGLTRPVRLIANAGKILSKKEIQGIAYGVHDIHSDNYGNELGKFFKKINSGFSFYVSYSDKQVRIFLRLKDTLELNFSKVSTEIGLIDLS